jgi:hypothetical protein
VEAIMEDTLELNKSKAFAELLEAIESSINSSPHLFATFQAFLARAGDPLHRAFLTRGLQAVTELASQLDADRLGEATSSSSNLEVLVSALNAATELPVDETDTLWLEARLRGTRQKEAMLSAEGGTASSAELGKLLGISRQAVDNRRKKNKLLALETAGHGYRYPLWQVAEQKVLPGVKNSLAELKDEDPWMTLQFFLRDNARLAGARPLDLLRGGDDGDIKQVVEAARQYGVQGAD